MSSKTLSSAMEDLTKRMQACVTTMKKKASIAGSNPSSGSTSRETSPLKKHKPKRSNRKKSTSTSVDRNKNKKYYLYPIGGITSAGKPGQDAQTPSKFIDIATIIDQGTFTHRVRTTYTALKPP